MFVTMTQLNEQRSRASKFGYGRRPRVRSAVSTSSAFAMRTRPHHPQSMLELIATLAPRIPVYRVTTPRLPCRGLPEVMRAVLHEHLSSPG